MSTFYIQIVDISFSVLAKWRNIGNIAIFLKIFPTKMTITSGLARTIPSTVVEEQVHKKRQVSEKVPRRETWHIHWNLEELESQYLPTTSIFKMSWKFQTSQSTEELFLSPHCKVYTAKIYTAIGPSDIWDHNTNPAKKRCLAIFYCHFR